MLETLNFKPCLARVSGPLIQAIEQIPGLTENMEIQEAPASPGINQQARQLESSRYCRLPRGCTTNIWAAFHLQVACQIPLSISPDTPASNSHIPLQ